MLEVRCGPNALNTCTGLGATSVQPIHRSLLGPERRKGTGGGERGVGEGEAGVEGVWFVCVCGWVRVCVWGLGLGWR